MSEGNLEKTVKQETSEVNSSLTHDNCKGSFKTAVKLFMERAYMQKGQTSSPGTATYDWKRDYRFNWKANWYS